MITNNCIAFKVSKFFFIVRMFFIAIVNRTSEGLFTSFFLMIIWFSFSFHREMSLIKNAFLKQAIQSFHATRDMPFFTANDDIGCPTFTYLFIDVINFILR